MALNVVINYEIIKLRNGLSLVVSYLFFTEGEKAMKKSLLRVISTIMAIAMLVTVFAGCGNKADGGANAKVKTISLLVPTDIAEETEAVVKAFHETHKNIKVEIVASSGDAGTTPTEISKLAASKKMPEVAFGVEDFGYILSQGLAYPLDNLFEADPDKGDALDAGINNYTYFDHLYALPYRVQFNGIMVNLDLIETKNLDEPDYNWTIDEFVDLAKKATDNKYSGINIIVDSSDPTHNLDTKLMGGLLNAPLQLYGYDMGAHKFNFTNGAWGKAKAYVEELKAVPGLISDNLKEWDKRNNGVPDAYDQKFGGKGDALKSGKVLFGNHNSWEVHWMKKAFNFEWDLYPVPHAEGVKERIQTHVDYVFLTSAVTEDNCKEAYELAKFLSYDKDGCIARMDWGKDNLENFAIYIPATENKKVIENYNKRDYIPDGMKYMLETIIEDPETIFIADANKIIPNFWNDLADYRKQVEEQIKNGSDPYALAADYEKKVNAAVEASWSTFVRKLEKNLEAFYESHPYEKK